MDLDDTKTLIKELLHLADVGPQMYTDLLLAAIRKINSLDSTVDIGVVLH